jgi:hypothetical protein
MSTLMAASIFANEGVARMPDERPLRKKTDSDQCEGMGGGNVNVAQQLVATVLECSGGSRLHGVPNVSTAYVNGTVIARSGSGGSSVDPSVALLPAAQVVSESIYAGGGPTTAASESPPDWSES